MLEILRRRFALSEKGAKDFCRGVLFTVMLDLALMLPAAYIFFFLDELLGPDALDVCGRCAAVQEHICFGI